MNKFMHPYYILQEKKPVAVDLQTWSAWFENADNRRIAWTEDEGCHVSTVFLGLNHNWGEGEPILFETMVFGGEYNEAMQRYSTYEDASIGHKLWCVVVFQDEE